MIMSKPLFLLDIDGVVNIYGAWQVKRTAHDQWLTDILGVHWGEGERVAPDHLIDAGRLLLHPDHPEWLAEIEAAGYQMTWATMWQSNAARSFAPVAGFGHDWPYIDFDHHQRERNGERRWGGVGGYKWPGIQAALGDDVPGVWIDDDMEDWQIEWAERRTADGVPTLFIRPETHVGMRRVDVEAVLALMSLVVA